MNVLRPVLRYRSIMCVLILLPAMLYPVRGVCLGTQHVLILHSYNKGLTWTDSEDSGIRSVLQTRNADLEVHTEYLDAKLVSDDGSKQRLFELLKHKYASIAFKVVLATDNDAYEFYLLHHDELFPGAPLVFCGVNYFKDSQRAGREDLFTGVVESFDIQSTLRTALRLNPHTSRVIVINDRTTTGLANRKIIDEEIVPKFSKNVAFVFYEDFTMDELRAKLPSLSPGDIILLMTFNEDRAGQKFSYDRSIALIAGQASVPIYGVWDFYLGKGIVGGMLTNGFDQGRTAAKMAVRIVDGESARAMAVVMESPNRYQFDYQQMRRFGMKTSDLPPGSTVINQPVSFYELNRKLVSAVIAGFFGLIGIILLLLGIIHQRRRQQQALFASEEKFRTLVNNLNVAVFRCSMAGHFLQVNPAMARIFGYDTAEDVMQMPVGAIYRGPEDGKRLYEAISSNGTLKDVEMLMRRKDGSAIWASVSGTAQRDDAGVIKWFDGILEDISERKMAGDALKKSHDELELKVRQRTSELSAANEKLQHRAVEIANLYEKARALSLHDSLTDLWNHEEILRILQLELARAERGTESVSVIMGDIDHFKQVNDTYGHLAGDKVLHETTSRMLSVTRSYDAVGRYGGEEFIVVAPGCDADCAAELAERIRQAIGQNPMDTGKSMVPITMSIGISVSGRQKGQTASSQVQAADRALYRAKASGRNRVEIASEEDAVITSAVKALTGSDAEK